MGNIGNTRASLAGIAAVWAAVAAAPSAAQDFGVEVLNELVPRDYVRGEIRDLKIGMHYSEILPDFYFEHACGSNGGPPLKPIGGFEDFAECEPEPVSGLHEAYVRYDDQNEFVVRLYRELEGEQLWLERFTGTKVGGHPVILSVLFNGEGIVNGVRAMSDPRASLDERRFAYLLRQQVLIKYGRAGWECVDLPPAPGERDVGGLFIKQVCTKAFPGEKWVRLETHLFRKPGQDGLDDAGEYKPGDFEASTRLEIFAPEVPAA